MTYQLLYLVTSLFGTYVIQRYMAIIFNRDGVNKRREFLSYLAYFAVSSFVYLFFDVPILIIACNLLGFFCLTFNYKGTFRQRLLAVLFVYTILLAIETFVVLISGYVGFSLFTQSMYQSLWAPFVINILSFTVALVISNTKNVKKGIVLPNLYWVSIVVIPLVILYNILCLLYADNLVAPVMATSIILLLLVTIISFRLYDIIIASYEQQIEKRLLEQQNKYFDNQFTLMKTSVESTKAMRHDLTNHLSALESIISRGQNEEALKYLEQISSVSRWDKNYAQSGNITIDSILNFKLNEARAHDIPCDINLEIPEELPIQAFDMVTILGNLLDNAIQAADACSEDTRFIDIKIKYSKGVLLLQIKNSYEHEIQMKAKDNLPQSTKEEKSIHGYGLSNVKETLKKYDGELEIYFDDHVFTAVAMSFLTPS